MSNAACLTKAGNWKTDVRCPKCKVRNVVYNGNYFCEGCSWALDHPTPTKMRTLYAAMYISLMKNRGDLINEEVVADILAGRA